MLQTSATYTRGRGRTRVEPTQPRHHKTYTQNFIPDHLRATAATNPLTPQQTKAQTNQHHAHHNHIPKYKRPRSQHTPTKQQNTSTSALQNPKQNHPLRHTTNHTRHQQTLHQAPTQTQESLSQDHANNPAQRPRYQQTTTRSALNASANKTTNIRTRNKHQRAADKTVIASSTATQQP